MDPQAKRTQEEMKSLVEVAGLTASLLREGETVTFTVPIGTIADASGRVPMTIVSLSRPSKFSMVQPSGPLQPRG